MTLKAPDQPVVTRAQHAQAAAGNALSIRPRPATAPGFKRLVVSTMKNEGPYIVEWIAHYLNLGFDGFVLYSNDCSDGTNLILNRLDAIGVVKHFDNPLGPRMDPQRRAYSRANKLEIVRQADWVLIADADEFLNIHTGDGSLDALLEALPDNTDAVSLNWRLFGSAGAKHMDPAPVTQRFTRACNVEEPETGLVWGFKTLFRPASFDYFGVHRPRFHKTREVKPDEVTWVTASGTPIGDKYLRSGWRSNARVVSYEFGQVNHYAVKSREEFMLKKLRGTANSKDKGRIDLSYWDKFDLNTFEDTSIRSGDLQGRIDNLLSDTELRVLHEASLDVSLRRIDDQMQEEEQRAFVDGKMHMTKDAAE
ncbi:glycosyltransferase family 2 protein [Rhodophyticola sp. CCM32]|nr:glycosyltransferase family 2 protein [Rhodophyticola sp. CCM32]